jgi:hypothetical protein
MKPGDTSSSEAASARQAPLKLWRVAQAFLATLYVLFGDPEDVAARHTLTLKAHSFMAGWLRCAEALLRRLLVLEAAAYPKPNTRPLLKPRQKRTRKLVGFDADAPEQWRVSFRCFASPGRGARDSGRRDRCASIPKSLVPSPSSRKDRWHPMHWKPVTFRSAWPLAERYEALLRVFNNPAAYARRLARRLHALPHRLGETLRAPPEAAHRVELFEDLGERVRAAWRPYLSSG